MANTQTENGKDARLWGVFYTYSLDFELEVKLASWKSKLKDWESTSIGCQFSCRSGCDSWAIFSIDSHITLLMSFVLLNCILSTTVFYLRRYVLEKDSTSVREAFRYTWHFIKVWEVRFGYQICLSGIGEKWQIWDMRFSQTPKRDSECFWRWFSVLCEKSSTVPPVRYWIVLSKRRLGKW